ncbi:MAG TPA: sodium:proton antiporter, partial [Opitutales bacterium]|nr:sodium:proton antiporter [Opitutales bacterium]
TLLLLIAAMPLAPHKQRHWWEKYYPAVSLGMGGAMAFFYLWRIPAGTGEVLHTLRDYLSFISLISSLYVVAGGIHLQVRGRATPLVNVVFLALGALLANVIGTTGASMVLIRPWLRLNKHWAAPRHVVVFIFLVSNIGGALTPIGDPPLFLGYLQGVPFFWLAGEVIVPWVGTVAAILAVFYYFDRRAFQDLPKKLERNLEAGGGSWRCDGVGNVLLLMVLVAAVFLPEAWFPVREVAMLGLAFFSWRSTPREIHRKNAFTFGPVKEVALLFFGIFLTMMPALTWIAARGESMRFSNPAGYYFACGSLSSVLDNAPTYLNFFQLIQSGHDGGALLLSRDLVAVSLGAVFFGAMTYIGNGPNFMVKAIAQEAGVECPTFFRYITRYSLPLLLPILAVAGLVFLA